MWVEGVGERERDAGHTHEHVGEGQVADEEVGDVVHFAGSTNDIEEQVIPKDAHHHNEHVTGDDERLEGLQQSHVCKLGGAVGGAVVIGVSVGRAAVITLHGGKAQSAKIQSFTKH